MKSATTACQTVGYVSSELVLSPSFSCTSCLKTVSHACDMKARAECVFKVNISSCFPGRLLLSIPALFVTIKCYNPAKPCERESQNTQKRRHFEIAFKNAFTLKYFILTHPHLWLFKNKMTREMTHSLRTEYLILANILTCIQLVALDAQVFIDNCGGVTWHTRTENGGWEFFACALRCEDEEASSFVRKWLYKQKEKCVI